MKENVFNVKVEHLDKSNFNFHYKNDFIAYNYNLVSEFQTFQSFIKGVCFKDDKLLTDEALKEIENADIKFVQIYRFNNIIELFNLSFITAINKNININICKNCHTAFIPLSRTDEKYCDNPSPQNPNKTCKEYGAKKAYRDTIKSNKIKNVHNNISQLYRMRINRSTDLKQKAKYEKEFETYKLEYQKKKAKYNNGKGSLKEDEFYDWLKNQKETAINNKIL